MCHKYGKQNKKQMEPKNKTKQKNKDTPPRTVTYPLPNGSCWMMVSSTVSADSFTSVTHAQCEFAVCDEIRVPITELPVLCVLRLTPTEQRCASTGLTEGHQVCVSPHGV